MKITVAQLVAELCDKKTLFPGQITAELEKMGRPQNNVGAVLSAMRSRHQLFRLDCGRYTTRAPVDSAVAALNALAGAMQGWRAAA